MIHPRTTHESTGSTAGRQKQEEQDEMKRIPQTSLLPSRPSLCVCHFPAPFFGYIRVGQLRNKVLSLSSSHTHIWICQSKQETTHHMHVTACVAGQEDVDVEVGEACRALRALKEAIVEALPKLCAEGFDVSVGGRALDDDAGGLHAPGRGAERPYPQRCCAA